MSMTLYLIRHADAQNEFESSDKNRSLTAKGRAQSEDLGMKMMTKGYLCDLALVSDALRCRQTYENMNLESKMLVNEMLYQGSAETYKKILAQQDSDLSEIMIVGHNPSCAMLAIELCGQGAPGDLLALRGGFGKGQLVVIHFNIKSWADIDKGKGYVSDIIHPDTLSKGAV